MKRNGLLIILVIAAASIFIFWPRPEISGQAQSSPEKTIENRPQSAVVSVEAQPVTVNVGQIFSVTVQIVGLDAGLSSFQADLDYDSLVVDFVSSLPGSLLGSSGRNVVCPTVVQKSMTTIRFACATSGSGPSVLGDGELFAFTFRAMAGGHSPLALSNLILSDDQRPPGLMASSTVDGGVDVADNSAPVAISDVYTTTEDTPLIVTPPGVLTNDEDAQGDDLSAVLDNGPSNGELSLDPDGSFIFTPTLNFNGLDSFTYHANDGSVDSNLAVVSITVTAENDPPLAAGDAYATTLDTPLSISPPGVLDNDDDVDGDQLTAVLDSGPISGDIDFNLDGGFVYTPTQGYSGIDYFGYHAHDGLISSNTTSVTINVSPGQVTDFYIFIPIILNPASSSRDGDRSNSPPDAGSEFTNSEIESLSQDQSTLGLGIRSSMTVGFFLALVILDWTKRLGQSSLNQRKNVLSRLSGKISSSKFFKGVSIIIVASMIVSAAAPVLPARAQSAGSDSQVPETRLPNEPINQPAPQVDEEPGAESVLEMRARSTRHQPRNARSDNTFWADLDGDHDVDSADLSIIAEVWDCSSVDDCYFADYDYDANNIIDAHDLAWIGNDYDVTPPQISIVTPTDDQVSGSFNVSVVGVVTDTHAVISVTVNDQSAGLVGSDFSTTITLPSGNQTIVVVAQDELGQIGIATHVVQVDADGPIIDIHQPKDRQAVYSLTPSILISYTDFYTSVDVGSFSAIIVDDVGVPNDVTADLSASDDGASGMFSTPLVGDTIYTLTISLNDSFGNSNSEVASFYVPVDPASISTPAEPENAGWVSGVIYDSSTCNDYLTICDGLPGASVTLAYSGGLPITGTIVTGPDGFFAFPVEETAQYWLRVEKENYTYGQRAADVVRERSTAVNEIYLTPIDPAVTFCDDLGCAHTSSDGILELDIPAGAIPGGEVVTTTATYFERVEFLPSGELPEGTWETFAFNLGGDSEITFNHPITVRVQNSLAFSPGTQIPLGYWNQDTMQWEHAGVGQVDPSGTWVVMTVTHFSNWDCNDAIEIDDMDDDEDDETGDRRRRRRDEDDDDDDDRDEQDERDPCDDARGAGCFINFKTGTLEEEISLPPFIVLGEEVAPKLTYHTDRVNPVRVIDVAVTIESGTTTEIDHLNFELYIAGQKTNNYVISRTVGVTDTTRYRFLWDGQDAQGDSLPPGVYDYAVRIRIPYRAQYCWTVGGIFGNPPDCVNGATGVWEDVTREVWIKGTVEIDPQSDSPFGAGWTLAGLQRLYENEAGLIMVMDDLGLSEFYIPSKNRLGGVGSGLAAPVTVPPEIAGLGRPAQQSQEESERVTKADSVSAQEERQPPSEAGSNPPDGELSYRLNPEEMREPNPPTLLDSNSLGLRRTSPEVATFASGVITQSTTWDISGSPYVITEDLTIQSGAILTIAAGVELRFDSSAGLFVSGALHAVGTPSQPITFTSNITPVDQGQWDGLFFNPISDDAHNHLAYVTLSYAGMQVYWQGQWRTTCIGVIQASPTIEQTTVRHCNGSGLEAYDTDLILSHITVEHTSWHGLYLREVGLTLNDSTIQHNGLDGLSMAFYSQMTSALVGNDINNNSRRGIDIYASVPISPTLTGNTIRENATDGLVFHADGVVITPTLTGNTIISHTWDAIIVDYNGGGGLPEVSGNIVYGNGYLNGVSVQGTLGFSTSWHPGYSLPFGLSDDLTIPDGIELSIEPGVELISGYYGDLVVRGALRALGSPSQPITLTTYSTKWDGISYNATSDDARNLLEHVTVEKGDIYVFDASPTLRYFTIRNSNSHGLEANATTLSISDCLIEGSYGNGVYGNNAVVNVSNCTLRQNGWNGFQVYAPSRAITPTLTGNTIISNTDYGVHMRYSNGGGLPILSGNLIVGNAYGDGVSLRGTLGFSMTWPADYPQPILIDGDFTVLNGAELVVEPGLTIRLRPRIGIFIEGALRAIGTPSQPITFTAITVPTGDYYHWEGILFDDTSDDDRSVVEHVTLLYSGYSSNYNGARGTGIGVYDSAPSIQHVTIKYGSGFGFWARDTTMSLNQVTVVESDSAGIYLWNAGLTLTDSAIINNIGPGIRVRDIPSFGLPVVSGTTIDGNYRLNGVVVEGILNYSFTWPAAYPLPIVIDSVLEVAPGAVLTIEPGATLFFEKDTPFIVWGVLHAVGTSNSPITFSSAEPIPDVGDWNGLILKGSDSISRLAYCDIGYAGRSIWWEGHTWKTSLGFLQSNAEVSHCAIHDSSNNGAEAFDASPLFNNNVLRDNLRGMTVDGNSVFSIRSNQIYSNTQEGLQNTTGLVMDARQNWWGDATGPYHPTSNPGGLGNSVSDDVLFDPWLTEPVTTKEIAVNRTETDYSTLVFDTADGTYTRQHLDGTLVHFNADGRHDYTLDPVGNKTIYTYLPDGSLDSMFITPVGASSPSHLWSFAYISGTLHTIIDPAGQMTQFDVDRHNHLNAVAFPDGSTRRFFYDDRGLLTQEEDEEGQVTTFSYDAYGSVRSETLPQRVVVDPSTGQAELTQEVRHFTPSSTAYPLLNDSPIGDPDAPAPPVPLATDLVDRIDYGRGSTYGHTNSWGSWQDRTDALERTTTYEHDDRNNLIQVTYADGSCVAYTYDILGNMLSQTPMEAVDCAATAPLSRLGSHTWNYTHESRYYQIKTLTDPGGNTTTYVYDYEEGVGDAGNLIRIEYPTVQDENGVTINPTEQFTYNALGLIETETNMGGMVTRYMYTQGTADEVYGQPGALFAPGVSPVPGLLTRIIRDEGGFDVTTIFKEVDAQGHALTVLGPRHPGASQTTACSSCIATSYENSSQGTETHYTYDTWGRLLTEEDALGIVTRHEYSAQGILERKIVDYTIDGVTGRNIVTEFSHDPHGQLLNMRTAADGVVQEKTYTYDINRNISSFTDGNGHASLYSFDDVGQLITETDALGYPSIYSYTETGALSTITLADGAVHLVLHDGFGRVTAVIVDEGGLNLVTGYSYGSNGNLLTETDPAGMVICYGYDALNRITSETRDCGGLDLPTTYAYDAAGNLAKVTGERGVVTRRAFDTLGRLVSVRLDADGLNLETSYAYDQAGNLVEAIDERGVITSYEYDPLDQQTVVRMDAAGLNLTTLTSYDRLGFPQIVIHPDGTITRMDHNAFGKPMSAVEDEGHLHAVTGYTYDNNLNLDSIVDGNGNRTEYSYNGRDQQTEIRYADGATVQYNYHPDDMLAWRIDQSGVQVDFTYDGANQLIHKSYPDGSSQTIDYDDAGRATNIQQTMSGHTTEAAFTYNVIGHIGSMGQTVDGHTWTTTYDRDYGSGMITGTYPSGVQIEETIDALRRLSSVSRSGLPVAGFIYDDLLGLVTQNHANGLSTTSEIDSIGRLIRVNSSIADYHYGYDEASNRAYEYATGQPADVYQYDTLNQLTQVWYGADGTDPGSISSFNSTTAYLLDMVGNRLDVQTNGASQTYMPNDGSQLTDPMNRYGQVGGFSFTYDPNGNLTSDSLNSYSYDYEDRQIGMTGPGGTAEYFYDALGQRVASEVNGTTTYFIYDDEFQVIEERSGSNTLVAYYIHDDNMDNLILMNRGGADSIYHQDALGNVRALSGGGGAVVERYTYDVYGQPSFFSGTGTPLPASAVDNPYLFTGRRYDPESGNYYYRHRMYSPESGRFLQMDPLGYVDGFNLYSYVGNNPTTLVDPLGLNPNGWLCRNVGNRLGSIGRGLFCLGPGMACRNLCLALDRGYRIIDPCDESNLQECLDRCQGQVDRIPRPTVRPSPWWIARQGFRLIFGR